MKIRKDCRIRLLDCRTPVGLMPNSFATVSPDRTECFLGQCLGSIEAAATDRGRIGYQKLAWDGYSRATGGLSVTVAKMFWGFAVFPSHAATAIDDLLGENFRGIANIDRASVYFPLSHLQGVGHI